MQVTPSGLSLYYNIWNSYTPESQPICPTTPITAPFQSSPPSLGSFYSLFIQYSGGYWELFWNQINFYQFQDNTAGERIVTGNQSNVVMESNDMTQNDLTNVNTIFGTNDYTGGVNYCLPAIGFLYNNNWNPCNPGTTEPAAYIYFGGKILAGWAGGPGGTGNQPPPTWGSTTIGATLLMYTEQFQVGYNLPSEPFGWLLWGKGPVSG